uniref:Selenoprotein P N-terminal domain-containing protein n=3 Tax=Oryzias melastigma TaxID=30732 RepID=A0A3B3DJ65_ORYME
MIVNELEAHSLAMYWKLKKKAPPGVPVYQQSPLQTDVWEILDGDKDDFLIYDRCGLLTFHIELPNSFLRYPNVENGILTTYTQDICNCSANSTLSGDGSTFTRNYSLPNNGRPENDSVVETTLLKTSQNDSHHQHSHHHPHHQHGHHHPHHQHSHRPHLHRQHHSHHQNDDS